MKEQKTLVSIIIPSFNSESLIRSCLSNILKTNYKNFELILIDDCSTDLSLTIVKEFQKKDKRIKIIRNPVNSGPSRTRNNGIHSAQGEYIAFLETDMEVEPDWLGHLVDTLEKYPELGGVQSKVLDLHTKNKIQAVGIKFVPHTFWVVGIGFGEAKHTNNETKYVGVGAVGCMIRRDVLQKIGGFDEKLIHNIDDIDVGFRYWLTGNKIKSVPSSITYHWTYKPANIREKTTSQFKSEFYSQKIPRIFIKNYEPLHVIKYLFYYYLLYTARSIIALGKGNTMPLKGLVYATVWNIFLLPDTLQERHRIQKLRKLKDNEVFQEIGIPGNIFSVYKNKIYPLQTRKNW